MRARRVPRTLVLLVLAFAITLVVATPVAAGWEHPVDAPVVDPFRPPATRFSAGNRGLEYGTEGGEIVRAVDAGRVTFAGAVGRQQFVTIDHGDGLRSTSAFVARIDVVRGQRVRQGQAIAIAGPGFHLTARLGDVYVDPALLFAGAEVGVRLIDNAPPTVAGSGAKSSPWDPLFAIADAAHDLSPTQQFLALADAVQTWHHQECTPDESGPVGTTPEGRVLIEVGGLGSHSPVLGGDSDSNNGDSNSDDRGGASIGDLDTQALGYEPCDIVSFSYGGGATPVPFGNGAPATEEGSITADVAPLVGINHYEPGDTLADLHASALHLADLVDAVAAARPGQPIDIAAHSLGGVVTRLALEELARRHPNGLPVSVVVTIGSPHAGADLATAAEATGASALADVLLDPLLPIDDLRDAESVQQVAETGPHALTAPSGVPEGVTVVAIAGANDLVVPGEKAIWEGATNVVVPGELSAAPGAHSGLPGDDAVTREVELALAGLPPRCQALGAVLAGALDARGVSAVEDLVTVVAGFLR